MVVRRAAWALVAVGLIAGGATGARAQSDDGTGFLPGSQSERKLDGGSGYVCTATNALKDQKCSISCSSRETADCEDADGSGTPTCQCTKG